MSLEQRLGELIAGGRDAAPIRVSLAQACLGRGDVAQALVHLERALELDGEYSAAWKAYGGALRQAGRDEQAAEAWRCGLAVARARGDRQAEREMRVFLRRLERP